MTGRQQWEANNKFLDRLIARRDRVVLVTHISQGRNSSFLHEEDPPFLSRLYVLSDDGFEPLPPRLRRRPARGSNKQVVRAPWDGTRAYSVHHPIFGCGGWLARGGSRALSRLFVLRSRRKKDRWTSVAASSTQAALTTVVSSFPALPSTGPTRLRRRTPHVWPVRGPAPGTVPPPRSVRVARTFQVAEPADKEGRHAHAGDTDARAVRPGQDGVHVEPLQPAPESVARR